MIFEKEIMKYGVYDNSLLMIFLQSLKCAYDDDDYADVMWCDVMLQYGTGNVMSCLMVSKKLSSLLMVM